MAMQHDRPATISSIWAWPATRAGVGDGAGAERHAGILDRRPPAQHERERQHGHDAQEADADMRLAPADRFDRGLQERRPSVPAR